MCQQEDKFTDQDRYEICLEIMTEIIPELDRIYDDIRKYEQDNIIPPMKSFSVVAREVIEMMNKRKSIKERISKVRGILKRNTELSRAEIQKYEQEIEDKTSAVELLEQKLGL